MQKTNWVKVKEILSAALELDPPEREKFLRNAKISKEIKSEVESLLFFEEDAGDWMRLPAVEFLKDFLDGEVESVVGQKFGQYTVIGELGVGGMGAVYLAERTDGKFRQRVALKVLKREMNTAALRRRFQQEREILATLEHPNISRLIDTGTTEDNIPYIAMEYVKGLEIDDFCSKHKLDLNQRLDLFRKVCETVDFAHRNLVVHRDLKPSNIIVTEDGMPKLLDFGISKILSDDLANAISSTVTKMGVMTPNYASPEQLRNKSVTTATDIYSLGVILFELLTGHRPFQSKEDDWKEILNAVIEVDPPLPSSMFKTVSEHFVKTTDAKTAIRDVDDVQSRTNGDRLKSATDPNRSIYTAPQKNHINPQFLKGDLDNIILKALKKEPEQRYSSALSFSEDIKRYQSGLPVSARPDTFSYRAEKFIKRNGFSVGAGSLIMLAILGGIIATLWQANIAQAERAKAEKRFNDVRTLANSFLFNLAPKIEKLPGATPAREELISLALEYLDSLSKEASGDLELQRELAAAYEKVGDLQGNQMGSNLGDTQGAAKSYEKALSIRQKLYDQQPNNLRAMSDLASSLAKTSEIQRQVGTSEQVDRYFQKSFDLREEILRRNPNDFEARKNMAIAFRGKGLIFYRDAKYKEAVDHYTRAKDTFEKLLNEQPKDLEIAENIAYIYVDFGEAQGWDNDLEAAEISLKKALDLLTPLAENNPNNQNFQRNLMLAYMKKAASTIDTEDYEKAIQEYSKGVEIAENILKVDSQNFRAKWDVVLMKKNLADAVAYSGKPQESIDILTTTLERAKEISKGDLDNPKNLYEIANIRFKIGEAYYELKDYEASLKLFKKSNEEFRAVVDLDPKYRYAIRTIYLTTISIADSYAGLAVKQNDKDLYRKALENYQKALKGFTQLKNEGKFPEYDNQLFTQIATGIKKVESKLEK